MTNNHKTHVANTRVSRRILAIVVVTSLCVPRCLGAGELGSANLWVAGIGLIFQMSSQISTGWFGTELSTISGLLKSYTFEETTEYLNYGRVTKSRHYVFRTLDQSYRYSSVIIDNDIVQHSDNDPFEIGPPTGMPLTRARTLCEVGTPVAVRKTQTSQWSMIITHTVTSSTPNPFYTPPANINVTLSFITEQHPSDCLSGVVAQGVPKSSGYGIPRNGSIVWEYPHVNYWVVGGSITRQ